MKKLIVLITLIVCGAAIIFGNIHWNNKISAHGEEMKNTNREASDENVEEDIKLDISTYSSNLPKGLQQKMNNAISSGKPLQLVIYGSDATSDEEGAWPYLLTKQLKGIYGEELFNVTVLSEGNKTTLDVVEQKSYEEVNKLKPDVILFEPFMLNDNSGVIGVPNTINNIETMIKSWEESNKDVTILMQPTNPIHGATFYPKQVDELKVFAETNKIIYLNHWEKWPELADETMKEYLIDNSQPNEKGNKVWADFLINYFIAK
ncbi:SGNH/GDSL hydrolase family protein [Metabacillus sediminilitoris]|uniref:SGNH/GDSL hydrolase family protein n=1 Tax=Metabacillus sediminilitoris TaxID=2567941 RepID=A0A4S4C307_9BACI|nr:SGNH/GDSL hydrolase family protein [Metabacillus sediminilitoris]QGQ48180.1 SGNH/GDSL hydrolase family protein [Metabacillus sediminilitoris]THF81459.1 SGNH/GDSL hydrolase family protein [Metabacillus sediminilitoris]